MESKKIEVSIEGIAPLLQHRFPDEENKEGKVQKKQRVYVDKDDAEKALYRDKDGKICQPANHIVGCLLRASTAYKFEGQKTYKDAVKGGVFIEPNMIPHKITDWVIDRQPVVIMRARIMRARPRFDKWALDFKIEIIDERIDIPTFKDILEYAGQYIGLGDFRPRYGRFKVTKFQVKK